MADLEAFRKRVRGYYRQTYRADGKKYTQQDLAKKLILNEDELGKRLHGYQDEKTGRVWQLTKENVLDIVLALAEWQALNWEQVVELLDLMDYPLGTLQWKTKLQEHLSPHDLALSPTQKRMPSTVVPDAPEEKQQLSSRRRPFQTRDLPRGYVPRPKAFNEIKQLLLNHQENQTAAITTALRGAGGFGKTTLALALCHDPEIQAAFPDGILWVELGEQPPRPLDVLNGVLHSLDTSSSGAITLEEARDRWRTVLDGRVYLLVIDDVWQAMTLEPLLEGGPHCVRLVTTRNDQVLPEEAMRVGVDAMEPEEALAVLRRGLPEEIRQIVHQSALEALTKRLGYWPLLLTLANGMLVAQVRHGRTMSDALAMIELAYEARGVLAFDPGNLTERQRAVKACIEVSLRHLEEFTASHYQAVARYLELAVFPEDTDIPLAMLHRFWHATGSLDIWEIDDLCLHLHNLSLLLTCDLGKGTIRLHDVMRSYLVQRGGSHLPALHMRLLDASKLMLGIKRWADLPSDEHYLWQYLVLHLCSASRIDALQATLSDLGYLTCKVLYVGIAALEADLLLATTSKQASHVESAPSLFASLHRTIVRLSHLLRQVHTRAEVGGLLLVHLGSVPLFAAQGSVLESELPRPFLTAWHPLPVRSSSSLIRTLHGHTEIVKGCAVSPDGRWIVSASFDRTLKVWDTATGAERLSFLGHTDVVTGCAISPDGNFIISVSFDGTLKIWNAHTGQCLLTFPVDGALYGCAFHPDGEHLVACGAQGVYFLQLVV